MHPKKNYLMYICIVINDINILSQKRGYRVKAGFLETVITSILVWTKEWENTYQQIHGDVRSVLHSVENTVPCAKTWLVSLLKHRCLCCFVFSRFWDITVSYNSSHQMYTHNYNSGINDTRLSFMFLYLCHFLLIWYLFDLLPFEIHMDTVLLLSRESKYQVPRVFFTRCEPNYSRKSNMMNNESFKYSE